VTESQRRIYPLHSLNVLSSQKEERADLSKTSFRIEAEARHREAV
jgi:hypothetical protein